MQKPNNTKQIIIIALALAGGIGLLTLLNQTTEKATNAITADAAESGGGHDHNGDGKPDHD